MIGKIFKTIGGNFQTFLVTWVTVLIANQLFIFGACFAPYCLIAGLPHTGVIAALITYFGVKSDVMSVIEDGINQQQASQSDNHHAYTQPKDSSMALDDFEDTKKPYCPKCGSKMLLRTAKRGKFAGKKFWGCAKFPNCNGILNV